MRTLFLAPLSAVLLSACLTTQENPNYEHSTVYKGDSAATTQYASTTPATTTAASYQTATPTYSAPVSYEAAPSTYSAPVYANTAPAAPAAYPTYTDPSYTNPSVTVVSTPSGGNYAATTSSYGAPTDSSYNAQGITGTPGFMALQGETSSVSSFAQAAPALPAAQTITHSPVAAAGTPVSYDYTRNIIAADAVTTGQGIPDTVRVLQGTSGNYTVQPGDTVYSLSRKTCVGVHVIQSMNGIGADYGIKIGQSLKLPASVC